MLQVLLERRVAWRTSRNLAVAAGILAAALSVVLGQSPPTLPPPTSLPPPGSPALPPAMELKPLPINLPTALKLANVRALDIAAAVARLKVATALLHQGQALWLPSVTFGADYSRHDGGIQDVSGNIFDTSKSSLMFGAGSGIGTSAVISVTDAVFTPLYARQVVKAREAQVQAAANDTLVAVTDAYFTVEQARGEFAGAREATRRTRELVRRTEKLAEGLVPPVEAVRAKAELGRREQAELLARQRWQSASVELLRLLCLEQTLQIEPLEPPELRVTLIPLASSLESLLGIAQLTRPELAANAALVRAAEQRTRQEKYRPLLPNLLVRGASTPVTGTLGVGVFGGGLNDSLNNFRSREDIDVQLLWQLDNMGFGNKARIEQRKAETELAIIELSRIQNRVAAEVSDALIQARLAAGRVEISERTLRLAVESVDKNLAGVSQTRRAGQVVLLVVRPQEVVAAVQTLAQAYVDYYGAVADANRTQFRLYRAVGRPAGQCMLAEDASVPPPPDAVGQ